MKSKIFILLLILSADILCGQFKYLIKSDSCLWHNSLYIGKSQVGIIEKGNNRGEVEKYQRATKIPIGSAYCMAGWVWSFQQSFQNCCQSKLPFPLSGVANSIYDFAVKQKVRATYIPIKGDFIVWRKRGSWQGHVERIYKIQNYGWVTCIGFNTGGNNPRNGNGVKMTRRHIKNPLTQTLLLRGLVGRQNVS